MQVDKRQHREFLSPTCQSQAEDDVVKSGLLSAVLTQHSALVAVSTNMAAWNLLMGHAVRSCVTLQKPFEARRSHWQECSSSAATIIIKVFVFACTFCHQLYHYFSCTTSILRLEVMRDPREHRGMWRVGGLFVRDF